MAYTLDEFATDCRRIVKADPGPSGREAVRKKLEDLLIDDFVAAHCGRTPPSAPIYSMKIRSWASRSWRI